MIVNELLTKRPFVRPMPKYIDSFGVSYNPRKTNMIQDKTLWMMLSQNAFLREYYPSGHLINDGTYYPDKIKYDEETGQYFTEKVVRCAFPLQMIITAQHLVHLTGNDIRHELTDADIDDSTQEVFLEWQKGWLNENIETRFYELAKSVKITGDGALLFYLKDGKMHTKNLSHINGDTLYPHYDSVTGNLSLFARKFSDYDSDNKEYVQWVEVWDNKRMYRYRRDVKGIKGTVNKIKDAFGLDGWDCVYDAPHGFDEIPVVYHRCEDGACWSFVQDAIDKYELAVSYLCQNNMAYAFPIMVLQGEDVSIQGDMYGQVKAITAAENAKISYLERSNNTSAFELQLQTLLKQIFLGSFSVMPPEVRSGDLPGVAIKLIYSPSLDRAMIDAKEFDHVIDDIRRLFTFAYGIQCKKTSVFSSLNIISYIVPYVHQNAAEMINNLVQSVNAGILSKESASDQTGYNRNAEYSRIVAESKEAEKYDLLYAMKPQQPTVNENTKSE